MWNVYQSEAVVYSEYDDKFIIQVESNVRVARWPISLLVFSYIVALEWNAFNLNKVHLSVFY